MSHRLERILKLMSLLQSGASFNAVELAQATSVHRRTVFRDVALLRTAGIPIRFDTATACYSIAAQSPISPSPLAPSPISAEGIQAAELARCLEMACLGNFLLRGNVDAIGRSVKMIAEKLTAPELEGVEQLLEQCQLPAAAVDAGEQQHVLVVIARAIRQQRQLLLLIADGNRELPPLRLSNPQLVFAARGFTLVGQTEPDGRTMELRLGQIRQVSAVDFSDPKARV